MMTSAARTVGSVSAGRARVGVRIRPWLVAMALSFGISLVGGEAAQFLSAKDAVTWIYVKGRSDPVAVVRIASARRDFQRRGYFRIGLLPMAVIEDVKVEIRHAEDVGDLLVQTRQGLGMMAHGRALEVRRIALSLAGESEPFLRAESVRFEDDGRWQLRRVVLNTRNECIEAGLAWLQVTGPDAGQLVLETETGQHVTSLLHPEPQSEQPSTSDPP